MSLSLDHVGIAVADLDAAADRFRRLGFRLTERGLHTLPPPAPGAPRPLVGTGNHCAMLRRGYLELIGITDPAYAGRLRQDLARYEGLHIVAFGTENAGGLAEALRAAGLAVPPMRPLERPIDGPERRGLARFDIVDPPAGLLPEGHFFAIHHATPELLWQPVLLDQPNRISRLVGLTIAVADVADFTARLGRFLGRPAGADGDFALNPGKVAVIDGTWLAGRIPGAPPALPRIAGITLASDDLPATAALLSRNGVPFGRHGGALWIAPPEACGAFLEIVAA
jgi:catechol 2,3-dioxygenase-like lactoylglutathione lyase family enzyme